MLFDVNVSAEIVERAIQKLQRNETLYNVAAVFIGESTQPDLDGASWFVYATDGTKSTEVQAMVPRTYGGHRGMDVDPAKIERAVERAAGHHPVETRVRDLAAPQWVQIAYDEAAPDPGPAPAA